MKSLDLLGESPSLYFNNEEKIKTKFGSIITFVILILIIILFWGFGQDFFKRTNPNMSFETVNPLYSPKLLLNENNFDLAVRFEDFDMNPINNNNTGLYMILEFYEGIRLSNGTWNRINDKKYEMSLCKNKIENSGKSFLNEQLPNAGEKGWLCPNLNNSNVGGSYDANSNYIGFFMIKTYICKPGYKDFNGKECQTSDKQISDLFKSRIFFSAMIQSTIVTPSDYLNGINRILTYTTYDLDKNLYKDIILKFSENIIENDYGWIIQSKSISKTIGLSKEKINILSFDAINEENLILSSTFFFIKDYSKYIRTYKKIQEIVADVGGMMEIFLIIFSYIVGIHNNYYYLLKLSPLICLSNSDDMKSGGKMKFEYNNIVKNEKELNDCSEKELSSTGK